MQRIEQQGTRTYRSQPITLACLTVAVVMVACGADTDGMETSDDDIEATTEETVTDEATEPDETADDDSAEPTGDADDAADDEQADATALTGADGWSDPLDLDIPAPGTAIFEFDGSRFELEVRCTEPGEVPDDYPNADQPIQDALPFWFLMSGNGQADDGRSVRVDIRREIHLEGDIANRIRDRDWGGDGQLDRITVQNLGRTSAILESPSSADPDGAKLPVIRVTPDGVVTAQDELMREFEDETDVPEGPFTFAGRCQDGWPEDVLAGN